MAGNIYIAPYHNDLVVKGAGADHTSEEIEIPYYTDVTSVTFESDTAGTLQIQKELGGAYATFDSIPIAAGGLPTIKSYHFKIPAIKLVFDSVGAGTISYHVEVTNQ